MARVKVKVLKNHNVEGKNRVVGTEYLCEEAYVPFRVKVGYIEVIKGKKKKDASTSRKSKR